MQLLIIFPKISSLIGLSLVASEILMDLSSEGHFKHTFPRYKKYHLILFLWINLERGCNKNL